MSEPERTPPQRSGGARIAMTLLGVVLLLPGLCSLLTMLTMIPEIRAGGSREVGDLTAIWIITFFISAAGIWLMVAARRKAEPPA